MKLLFIRHGDPDYSIDSLTPTGWKEAELLSRRIAPLPVTEYYVSPLGRAKDTASITLQKCGRDAIELDWLREFPVRIRRPDAPDAVNKSCWDWLPQDWLKDDHFLRYDTWTEDPIMQQGNMEEGYRYVVSSFDRLLAEHGYERSGFYYHAVRPNTDTLAFFCHFGVTCVLLSRLMNVSPMVLWHGTCAAPTSVTTVVTEERRAGIASFRMSSFGDISHLYAAGEKPSFAARFCEIHGDGTRED